LPRKKKTVNNEAGFKIDGNTQYYLDVLVDIIGKMYGETARKVMEHIIESGGSAPEETIGRDAGVKSNEARKILQKLGNEALLTCRGRKVGDKVLHFWTINWEQVDGVLINRLKKTRRKLEILLKYMEENVIYECPSCGRRYTLDTAIDNDYQCPYDNTLLVESNKEEIISFLKNKIMEIDRELNKLGAL